MKNVFKYLDLFNYDIKFNYDGIRVYNSYFGLIFSFIFYGILIYFIQYFSRDMITKTNPNVVYGETQFDFRYSIKYLDMFSKFEIGFPIDGINNYSDTISESFKLFIGIQDYKKNEISQVIPVLKTNCHQKIDSNETYYVFTIDKLKAYNSTLEKDIIYNLSDYHFDIDLNSSLWFEFDIDEKIIKDYVNPQKQMYFYYQILDQVINMKSDNFFITYPIENYSTLDLDFVDVYYETKSFSFSILKKSDDKGFIFSEQETTTGIKKSYDSFSFVKYEKNLSNYLFDITFDKIMKIYERKYKKLQNVFADLGGIFEMMFILGNLFVYRFNKKKFLYDLVNRLFGEYDYNPKKTDNFQSFKGTGETISKKAKTKEEIPLDELKNKQINNLFTFENYDIIETRKKRLNTEILESNPSNILLDFEKKSSKNLNVSERYMRKSSMNLKITSHENGKCSSNYLTTKEKDLFETEIKKFIIRKNEKKNRVIKFSKFELLKTFLCCKNLKNKSLKEKEELFKKLSKTLLNYFEVISYLSIFENFENLKTILLDKDQAFSLNFLKKKDLNQINEEFIQEEMLSEYLQRYKRNHKTNNIDEIDKRIVDNFDPNLIKLIEVNPDSN